MAEQRIQEGIEDTKSTLATLERYKRDYEVVEKTLRELPAKVSHAIMVPIGSLAFMPGKLMHTNEITVLLGDNWFAERSATQAADIAVRRIAHVKEQIKSTKTDLTRLTADMKLAEDMRGTGDDDTVNIVEEYHSDEEKQSKHPKPTQQHPSQRPTAQESSAAIDASPYLARLKELEKLEREEEEEEEDEQEEDSSCTVEGIALDLIDESAPEAHAKCLRMAAKCPINPLISELTQDDHFKKQVAKHNGGVDAFCLSVQRHIQTLLREQRKKLAAAASLSAEVDPSAPEGPSKAHREFMKGIKSKIEERRQPEPEEPETEEP
eukprot:GILK01004967.1.p1 GENE.GILK01004967.1~~GILK01004967.1.p1  ORF type:complete len:356 (-),score=72.63 GILK01004967.1:96-1061(-)